MLVYVPLVWIRDLEKLAFTHLIGDVIIITVVVVIMTYSGIEIGDQNGVEVNALFTVQFFKAIPYSAFAFEGVAVVLPLREIVADHKGYYKLVCIVVGSICVFYIIFSEFTNLAYGNMCNYVLITDALPSTSVVTYTLKALYTVNLFCSYPLQISPAVNLLEGYIFDGTKKPTKKRYWL